MVDEYMELGVMYGSILRSDSSMVDEYHDPDCQGGSLNRVQIPLWSMNTRSRHPAH